MAVIMVAETSQRNATGLKGVRTMTTNIVMEMGYAADLQALHDCAVVLFMLFDYQCGYCIRFEQESRND